MALNTRRFEIHNFGSLKASISRHITGGKFNNVPERSSFSGETLKWNIAMEVVGMEVVKSDFQG